MENKNAMANDVVLPVSVKIHTARPNEVKPEPSIETNCPGHIAVNLPKLLFAYLLEFFIMILLKSPSVEFELDF